MIFFHFFMKAVKMYIIKKFKFSSLPSAALRWNILNNFDFASPT